MAILVSEPPTQDLSPDMVAPSGPPASAPSGDDLDRLTAELAEILARKPRRQEPRRSIPDDEADADEPAAVRPTGRGSFASALHHDEAAVSTSLDDERVTAADSALDDMAQPPGSAEWLKRAQRQRLYGALRQAGSWTATVAIGSAIVFAAALFLFTTPKDLKAWQDYGARAFKTSSAGMAAPSAEDRQGTKPQGRL